MVFRMQVIFDVARSEGITINLDKEDEEKVRKWLDEGKSEQVFFPDYEA